MTLGAAAALGAAAFLNDGETDEQSEFVAPHDPGPVHVHGLGLNPGDGALFIATHTGLWRSPPGANRSERVGESRQDTMGFTVAGPDYFLGSGHPDPQALATQRLPSNLGLIRSTDAGRSWQAISLAGQADFHVLRSAGDLIYGFDAGNGRLLVSRDGGRTWSERLSPGPLVDLAVHPTKSSRVVATAEDGTFISDDAASTWRQLGPSLGLLAWPAPEWLYLVAAGGEVLASRDAGQRWTRVGTIGGQPAAFLGATARQLYVALHDGTIKRSTDGGRSWNVRSTP